MGWFSRGHADEPEDPQAVIDRQARQPMPAPAGDFAMAIGDVFTITGRGTVAVGRIASGSVAVDDRVAVVRDGTVMIIARVAGVEKFRTKVDRAGAGENVGLLLDGADKQTVRAGDLLTPARAGS